MAVLVVTPAAGDWVRLVALRGVSSPTMRAQVGEVGTVLATLRRGGEEVVQAAFSAVGGVDDVFWLKPGEWELVGTAAPAPDPPPAADCSPAENACSPPENPPPPHRREEQHPVSDFATAVQRRIDQLADQEAHLAAQAADLARQREENRQERRALLAGVAAYQREKTRATAPPRQRALPAPRTGCREGAAVPVLRAWAAEHGAEIVLVEVAAAAFARGAFHSERQAYDNLHWALRKHGQRVGRGRYRWHDAAEAAS